MRHAAGHNWGMPRYVLNDEQVVDLLKSHADSLRHYSGETREAEHCLRTVEWLTRATNERLFVYLHMRDLATFDAMEEIRRLTAPAKALDSPGGKGPAERE